MPRSESRRTRAMESASATELTDRIEPHGRTADLRRASELHPGCEAVEGFRTLRLAPGPMLVVCLWGRVQLAVDDGSLELSRGQFAAIDTRVPASVRGDSPTALALVLRPDRVRHGAAWVSDVFPIGMGRLPRPALGVAAAWLRTRSPEDADACCERIVLDARHRFCALLPRCPGSSLRQRARVLARFEQVQLFIAGHLDNVVRVEDLARVCSYSPSYFVRTFHFVYGQPPMAMLSKRRLNRAVVLLRRSELAVAEIANACGFESPCSFSRAFSRRKGISPGQFRRLHRHS
ncbi:MAG TPA: AraC family transcriptional regulator [Xanthomonadaceae bacterium]|nr:AraC family transcriptional regulator [Xanthomonadaceae bacterium]